MVDPKILCFFFCMLIMILKNTYKILKGPISILNCFKYLAIIQPSISCGPIIWRSFWTTCGDWRIAPTEHARWGHWIISSCSIQHMNQGSAKKGQRLGKSQFSQSFFLKQDAAHEPECSHVQHFCEKHIWTVLCIFPCYRAARLWNAEEGGVQSVEGRAWSVKCGV